METIRIERITDPLTTGNCYILLENGHAVIIDPNDEDRIEEVLRQYEAEPDYVLLTHEHADHISGLNGLREHYRFQTVAYPKQSLENFRGTFDFHNGRTGSELSEVCM